MPITRRTVLLVSVAGLIGVGEALTPQLTKTAGPDHRDKHRNPRNPGSADDASRGRGRDGARETVQEIVHRGRTAKISETARGVRLDIDGVRWPERLFERRKDGTYEVHEVYPFDLFKTPNELAVAIIDGTGGVYTLIDMPAAERPTTNDRAANDRGPHRDHR